MNFYVILNLIQFKDSLVDSKIGKFRIKLKLQQKQTPNKLQFLLNVYIKRIDAKNIFTPAYTKTLKNHMGKASVDGQKSINFPACIFDYLCESVTFQYIFIVFYIEC